MTSPQRKPPIALSPEEIQQKLSLPLSLSPHSPSIGTAGTNGSSSMAMATTPDSIRSRRRKSRSSSSAASPNGSAAGNTLQLPSSLPSLSSHNGGSNQHHFSSSSSSSASEDDSSSYYSDHYPSPTRPSHFPLSVITEVDYSYNDNDAGINIANNEAGDENETDEDQESYRAMSAAARLARKVPTRSSPGDLLAFTLPNSAPANTASSGIAPGAVPSVAVTLVEAGAATAASTGTAGLARRMERSRISLEEEGDRMKDHSAVKTGYLMKKGERRTAWRKRWFVLRGGQVAMYKNDKEYRLLRLIPLSSIHICAPIQLKNHSHTFGIVTPQRTYYVQADDDAQVREWCSCIQRAKEQMMGSESRNSSGGRESEEWQVNDTLTATGLASAGVAALSMDASEGDEGLSRARLMNTRSSEAGGGGGGGFGGAGSLTSSSFDSTVGAHSSLSSSSSVGLGGSPVSLLISPGFLDQRSLSEASSTISKNIGAGGGVISSSSSDDDDDGEEYDDDDTTTIGRRTTFSVPDLSSISPSTIAPVAIPSSLRFSSGAAPTTSHYLLAQSASPPLVPSTSPSVQRSSPLPALSPSTTPDSNQILLSGYLMKQSKRRTWRKRWFVLMPTRLIYSRNHMTMDLSPRPDATSEAGGSGKAKGAGGGGGSLRGKGKGKGNREILVSEIMDALEWSPASNHGPSPTLVSVGLGSMMMMGSGAVGAGAGSSSASGLGMVGLGSNGSMTALSPSHSYSSSPSRPSSALAPATSSGINNQHCFKIITPKRTYLVCSPSEEEEIRWLAALQALVARRNAASPSASSTAASAAQTLATADADAAARTTKGENSPRARSSSGAVSLSSAGLLSQPKFFKGRGRSTSAAVKVDGGE